MKKKITRLLLCVFSLSLLVACGEKVNKTPNEVSDSKNSPISTSDSKDLPIATIEIAEYGTITAELYPDKAPNTVNNFISLANSGFYDDLTIHRVFKDFVLQGGCPEGTGMGGPGYSIKGEFDQSGFKDNDVKHKKGVLSMARSQSLDSAGSQFFIMTGDAGHLDGAYAAFGNVIEGLDVVDKINNIKAKAGTQDTPSKIIKIKSIKVDTKGIKYDEPVKV